MTVGLNISDLRKRRGLTLDELSALCGVNRDDLGQYERGGMTPRPDTVQKIAQALDVPIAAIQGGMGWTAPRPTEGWETSKDDSLLYHAILENLKESYGAVENESGGEGQQRFQVGTDLDGFVLEERDIRALMEAVKASIPALIEHMKDTRSEAVVNREILQELDVLPEDSEQALIRQYELTDDQWEQLRELFPSEKAGKGRALKSNRLMLNGILYWMKTGIAWKNLPQHYGRYKCVSDRLRLWNRTGVWTQVVTRLLELHIIEEDIAEKTARSTD